MHIRFASIAISLSLLLVTLGTACSPQPTGAPGGSSGAAPAAQAKPLRIGASMSLTGQYARIGKNVMNAYQLWAEQTNAKGGLLGRQVELVTYDDQSEPETAAKLYEKLISEDQVDLVIGPYSSPVTIAASVVTEKYHFPMIASG